MPTKTEKKKPKAKAAPVNVAFTMTEQLKSYFADVVREIKATTRDKIAELEKRDNELSGNNGQMGGRLDTIDTAIGELAEKIKKVNGRIDELDKKLVVEGGTRFRKDAELGREVMELKKDIADIRRAYSVVRIEHGIDLSQSDRRVNIPGDPRKMMIVAGGKHD